MTDRKAAALIALLAVAPAPAFGQSPDAAAERARLGNERIQAEAERRAQEEQEAQERATGPAGASDAAPSQPPPPQAEVRPAEPRKPPADDDRTERVLQQLRELGALKDAGYLTDAEFQRIKQRILDSHF